MLSWPNRYKQLQTQCKTKPVHDFYQSAIDNPTMPISEVPLVALDFETTGLDYLNNDIVSVGLVPFNTQRIRCRDSQQWLVKPRQTLAEDSILIHGITHSEVNQAPDFSEIITPLLTALSGKVIVVHFAAVERHFLYHALKERLNEGLEFAVIDTMELEKRALKARQGLLGRVLNNKLDSVRLADTRLRYALPAYNNHNALTDALATAELLQAQLAYHYRPDTPLCNLWI